MSQPVWQRLGRVAISPLPTLDPRRHRREPMNIFVLTGAGISAESGLGTFRDKAGTGIWARFDPMRLATPGAFARDPVQVHAFYNMRRQNLLHAQPNAAHFSLAKLEAGLAACRGWPFLCTQNIDELH